ncbi:hypothetical protein FOCC_FOCC007523, partial [Frankliniella occidentalis]
MCPPCDVAGLREEEEDCCKSVGCSPFLVNVLGTRYGLRQLSKYCAENPTVLLRCNLECANTLAQNDISALKESLREGKTLKQRAVATTNMFTLLYLRVVALLPEIEKSWTKFTLAKGRIHPIPASPYGRVKVGDKDNSRSGRVPLKMPEKRGGIGGGVGVLTSRAYRDKGGNKIFDAGISQICSLPTPLEKRRAGDRTLDSVPKASERETCTRFTPWDGNQVYSNCLTVA